MMRSDRLMFVVLLLFYSACSNDDQVQDGHPSAVVPGVAVELVRPIPVDDFFTTAGTVKAKRATILSSKITGIIIAVAVHPGDLVRKGRMLVQIDSRELRSELASANAGLEELTWASKAAEAALTAAEGQRELAAATYQRYEALLARESVTRQEFDEVNTKFKVATAEMRRAEENLRGFEPKKAQAKARIAQAQTLLSQTNIVAPYDGVVTGKAAELGMLATPGASLVTLEEQGAYRLETQVGESDIQFVRLGKQVSLSIDVIRDDLTGSVVEIVPAADPRSRTFAVKVQLPAHSEIRSGLYGKARFSIGKRDIIAVPSGAVVSRGELKGLYIVGADGAVQLRLVKTGRAYGDRIEILSGLKATEQVVVKNPERLREGDRVRVPRQTDGR
jgi:membrane fusion protein, multidrug efflux system